MLTRGLLIGSVALIGGVSAYGLAPSSRPTTDDTYTIDPVHSSMVFRIKHNNVAYFYGRFNEIKGTIKLDSSNDSSLELSIPIAGVDTGNQKRDQHLKSPDFFNAEKFPTSTFKSTKVTKASDSTFDVTGDLTMHGVTKPVTLKLEKTGQASNPRGGELIGFETTFTISRKDFGITYMPDGLGDDIRISVGLEAKK